MGCVYIIIIYGAITISGRGQRFNGGGAKEIRYPLMGKGKEIRQLLGFICLIADRVTYLL